MNSETGQIMTLKKMKELDEIEQAKCVPIDPYLMTPTQKRNRQVSLKDTRSPLGRRRINMRGKLRNEPCPCGSGVKFKKCCWSKRWLK